MHAKDLKNSILQFAVSGKLVPQDASDEPAVKLLERIRAERESLVRQKKIKNTKVEPITEEDVPFEVPESWEWVRLGEIAEISGGNTPQKTQLSKVGIIPYYKVADMNTKGNELNMTVAFSFINESYNGKIFPAGTIIFPKNGGAVLTNKRRVLTEDSVIDLNTAGCTPFISDCLSYVKLFLDTVDFGEIYKGTAVPTVNAGMVRNFLLPLPPLAEHKRIVQKVQEVMGVVV